ncbi:hypothetical protein LZ496_13615 [Sphingomonas sp. NSE70-1]|uniref:Beta-lactamase-inhibitor-like, PepSY-like n=1 Tax=Sphingomonas caseinilyticus TaxID=2908205 RepID=A0ABT0RXQ2_9SPHN|nr:hypothetical protein [Sphingomonas caseinilyticus]MCL6699814.1 hypothetical protein [Sphingomonas caseinilyticus]
MKLIVAGVALLLIAAAPAPTPTYDWKLTPTGWGPVRIGMNRDQVQKALNDRLEGDAFDNEGSCIELFPQGEALKGSYFMFLDGKLSRISVSSPSKIVTPRGIGVGASADEVHKAYGEALKAEPNHYVDLPAEYLTFWLKPEKSGVRFETDAQRKVEIIHAGDSSIQYIEGCA